VADIFFSTSVDGVALAEAVWADGTDLADLRARAIEDGAGLLWVHGGDLARFGFTARPGYTQLTADKPKRSAPLPVVPDTAAAYAVLPQCFADQWGHHLAEAHHLTAEGGVTLQLVERGAIVGLCRVTEDRHVDDIGLVPGARKPARYRRMLAGACGYLGPGPVTVDSWGQEPSTIAAWKSLGFTVTESYRGWEVLLTPPAR
jgi:hypothetical protein